MSPDGVKRKILAILLIVIAMLYTGGLSGSICNASRNSPEVRVGTELDFPPYAFLNESGEPTGFSVDLIKAVSDAMGLSIRFSTGTWDKVWKDLVAGQLDALPIVAKLPERQRLVDFSLPHTETYDAFFVRQGDPLIESIVAARRMEIVVMRSDAAHHGLLENNFQGNLVFVDTLPEGLSLISSGKHNALLCSKLIGSLLIQEHGLKGLTVGPPIEEYKRAFSFSVKKGDMELLEKLNQGLLIIKTNGEYGRIYEKWLAVHDPWEKAQKYILPTTMALIAIALIAWVWALTLLRLIRKRDSELAKRRLAEKTLQQSEKEYRELVDNANSIILKYDTNSKITFFNEYAQKFFGYHRDEILGKNVMIIVPEKESTGHVLKTLSEDILKRPGDYTEHTNENICKNGERVWISWRNRAIKDSKGNVIENLGIGQDVTERKQIEKTLQDRTHDLGERVKELNCFYSISKLFENPNVSWEETLQGVVDIIPPSWQYPEITCGRIFLEDKEYRTKNFKESKWNQTGEITAYGRPIGRTEVYYLEEKPESDEGPFLQEERHLISGITELLGRIMERKHGEEKIKKSLKEKEILLREIHHRVKNNMQVIISLLSLQADKIEDKRYADMFIESQNRIKTMSLVHEKLYQTKDFSKIDFAEHVKSFVKGLFLSHGVDPNRVSVNLDIENISFDLENAIPCGLIINELVSNSLKHAFVQKREGEIKIALHAIDEDELELSISDNGVGIPEDLDIEQIDTMGLHLVNVIAGHQLDGKIEIGRIAGTQFIIKFKNTIYKTRI